MRKMWITQSTILTLRIHWSLEELCLEKIFFLKLYTKFSTIIALVIHIAGNICN